MLVLWKYLSNGTEVSMQSVSYWFRKRMCTIPYSFFAENIFLKASFIFPLNIILLDEFAAF